MSRFPAAWRALAPATQLSLFAALCVALNPWLGLVIGLAAAWVYAREHVFDFQRFLPLWFFAPSLVALAYVGFGESLPSDDLMRHLSAWQLGFDYRAQYPWSTIPKADLWLGYDWLLGVPQRLGISKAILLQWIPGLSIALQSLVLFFALQRAVPKRHHNAGLFLLAGALGLLIMTPRSLLGRPEMFLLIFGASAWLAKSRRQAAAWLTGYLVLVPCYWLGWVYAPFALLLAPRTFSLVARILLTAVLGLVHLVFWQWYTGDYVGVMLWLKSTLSVRAGENDPLLIGMSFWFSWVLIASLSFVLSTLNRRRFLAALPVVLLLVWFALPNQIRYTAGITFVVLPWMYQRLVPYLRLKRLSFSPLLVLLGLAMAAALAVFTTEPHPKFALGEHARVYSESPYAAVFYGQPGIAVEPSFALGATKPEWKDLESADGQMRCDLLLKGGFTNVIEKSLRKPIPCADLTGVQGAWRLWTIRKP
ncbi:hypothetical protein KTD31_00340 [Burkholderia multivorans]|uniref:hypothetical protein n=1 Tax=Burkholderia multivorans TaxID=87883 RepID=UPI001C22CFB1|nr:hypothetical protein [Burkholderia multivorans]MBU9199847.1 hypothetical protein [Burkholderia multivorans]MDN8079034.1 hypothetical protein [Burkholderia multivorans]